MVSMDDAVVARYDAHGERFEILLDPKITEKLAPDGSNLLDLMASDLVFRDSKKGTQASEESLQKVFNTTDRTKVIQTILGHSQIGLTADTYTHVLPELHVEAADLQDALLGRLEEAAADPSATSADKVADKVARGQAGRKTRVAQRAESPRK